MIASLSGCVSTPVLKTNMCPNWVRQSPMHHPNDIWDVMKKYPSQIDEQYNYQQNYDKYCID
jgi:hypothetical protein